MNIQDAVKFTNENPVSFLATCEGQQPRVRGLLFWFADETGFYFQTGDVKKDLCGQLKTNPRVEACFFKSGPTGGETWRITGAVEFVDTPELRKKCLAERPFLRSLGIDETSPALVMFRISKGEATYWNMQNNLKPKEIIKFGT